MSETGIELQFVAPPDGLGLDLEIERAPDSGGSPGTWAAIDKLDRIAQLITPYVDTTVQMGSGLYWYRGRLSGAGVSAGAYATIAAPLTPGYLLVRAHGEIAGEPVLGVTKTIRFPGVITQGFVSTDRANLIYFGGAFGAVEVFDTGTTTSGGGFLNIPRGAVLTAVRVRGAAGTSASLTAKLYQDSTVLATLTWSAESSSTKSASLSQLVGAETYVVWVQFVTGGSLVHVVFEYIELDYTVPSYAVGI